MDARQLLIDYTPSTEKEESMLIVLEHNAWAEANLDVQNIVFGDDADALIEALLRKA